jgi:hypothetical protein
MKRTTEFLVGTASSTDPTLVKSDSFLSRIAKDLGGAPALLRRAVRDRGGGCELLQNHSGKHCAAMGRADPASFVFNLKALALLTQHASETKRLPLPLRRLLSVEQRAEPRLKAPPKELLNLAFQMFRSSLGPLRES